jgi:hypothetical protein
VRGLLQLVGGDRDIDQRHTVLGGGRHGSQTAVGDDQIAERQDQGLWDVAFHPPWAGWGPKVAGSRSRPAVMIKLIGSPLNPPISPSSTPGAEL